MKYNYSNLILIGIATIVLSCNSPKKFDEDYNSYELVGNVKEVNVINNKGVEFSEASFTQNGHVIHEKYSNSLVQYTYEDDLITELKSYLNQKVIEYKRKYTYNDKQQMIEVKEFDARNTYTKKMCYFYDQSGNMIRNVLLTPYNDTIYLWLYTYSKTNKKLTESQIDKSDAVFERHFKYLYDKNDNIVEIKEYDGKELIRRKIFKQFHGFPLMTKLYTFWSDKIIDSTDYKYTFDDKGNWILRKEIPQKGNELQTTRKILYYE